MVELFTSDKSVAAAPMNDLHRFSIRTTIRKNPYKTKNFPLVTIPSAGFNRLQIEPSYSKKVSHDIVERRPHQSFP